MKVQHGVVVPVSNEANTVAITGLVSIYIAHL